RGHVGIRRRAPGACRVGTNWAAFGPRFEPCHHAAPGDDSQPASCEESASMDTPTRPALIAGEDPALARMRALLQHAPVAMAFTRAQRFELVSEHMNHLFGHGDGTELAGLSTRAVHVSDAAHTMLAERLASAFAAGRPLDEEIEYARRDGSRF